MILALLADRRLHFLSSFVMYLDVDDLLDVNALSYIVPQLCDSDSR
jgi:hypothetical protein